MRGPDVVVVGAGVGGLAAAIRLQASGHRVVVLDRLASPGGKLGSRSEAGFTWETGPSLLTLRSVFDELVAAAGHHLDDLVDLVRLDPICRYRFADGSGFSARADLDDTTEELEAIAPGSGREYRRFIEHGARIWEVAERTFLAGPLSPPRELLGRMRSPGDLLAIDGLARLHSRAARHFTDPRLVQWAGRYATYSGSSPFLAPATLACIPAVEQLLGGWYVDGGLDRLAGALAELATDLGVELRLGVEVEEVTRNGGRATGVRLAGGERITARSVVANVDALDLHRRLLDRSVARPAAVQKAPRSSSGYVLLLGVDGPTDELGHHNVSFSADSRTEFDQLFSGQAQSDPTVYVCCSVRTDAGQAPPGQENWFVLVNAPANGDAMERYGDHVLEVMARRGWDLTGRIRCRVDLSPADFERRFRTPGGSIYGTSSNGWRAAFLRPSNRGPLDGLFLCGGSSHPGGGLPLVAVSGRIAAGLADDFLSRTAG